MFEEPLDDRLVLRGGGALPGKLFVLQPFGQPILRSVEGDRFVAGVLQDRADNVAGLGFRQMPLGSLQGRSFPLDSHFESLLPLSRLGGTSGSDAIGIPEASEPERAAGMLTNTRHS